MSTVISIENLSKSYHLGQIGTGTFARDLELWWAKLRGKPNPFLKIGQVDQGNRDGEEVWALKNVSFTVEQGEVLGIIGKNGAGKSTLLKILSRVTAPTLGKVKVKGRIASLLEVGTGFHPELTGRENVYLNGSILGMRRKEIDRKFDEIVEFSGVEKYIDTPVKRYSSGMHVRLGFAVAAHLEPEILVVDEVLAVGDAEFQRKCLGKMSDVAHEGRTVLFVSHNMTAVKGLCQQAILLQSGMIVTTGATTQVIDQYLSLNRSEVLEQHWENIAIAPGNDFVRVKSVKVEPQTEDAHNIITVKTPLDICFEFWNLKPGLTNLSIHFETLSGDILFAATSKVVNLNKELAKFVCHIPGSFLNDGIITIRMMIVRDSAALFVIKDAVILDIHDAERSGNWWGKWPGVIRPTFDWEYYAEDWR